MGLELTGKYVSATYLNLVQHVSDNYYDGAGNTLSIVDASSMSTSLVEYISNASLSNDFLWNNDLLEVSLGSVYGLDLLASNVSVGLSLYSNASLGLANNSYATNASVGSALLTNASLGYLSILSDAFNTSIGWLDASMNNVIESTDYFYTKSDTIANFVSKTGSTMTGNLTINSSLFINGNVGVGTNIPTEKLHIVATSADDGLFIDASNLTTSNRIVDIYTNDDTAFRINAGNTQFTDQFLIVGNNFATEPGRQTFRFTNYASFQQTTGAAYIERVRFTKEGSVGIGKIPSYTLDISGNVYFTGSAIIDGSIILKNSNIINLITPVNSSDAANKWYVDNCIITNTSLGLAIDIGPYSTNASINLAFLTNASLGLIVDTGIYSTNASVNDALTNYTSFSYVDTSLDDLRAVPIKDTCLGTGVSWTAGKLYVDVSVVAGGVSLAYVDGSLATRDQIISTLATNASLSAFMEKTSIGITIDGGGTVITTGSKGHREIDNNYTLKGWTLLSDVSGNLVIDIKCTDYTNWPATTSIAGEEKPTLTAEIKNTDTDLSTWQTNVSTGDIIEFIVDSAETITKAWLFLNLIKR